MRLVSCSMFAALLVGSVALAADDALARGAGIGVGRGPAIRSGAAPLLPRLRAPALPLLGKPALVGPVGKPGLMAPVKVKTQLGFWHRPHVPRQRKFQRYPAGGFYVADGGPSVIPIYDPLPETSAAGDRMSYPPICVADAPSEAGGVRHVTVTRCNIRPRPY